MNRKITGLVSMCIGMAFCAVPMMGQNRNAEVEIRNMELSPGNNMELRAAGGPWFPDSLIDYTSSGERETKYSFDWEAVNQRKYTEYEWENNRWVAVDYSWSRRGVTDTGYFSFNHEVLFQQFGNNSYQLVVSSYAIMNVELSEAYDEPVVVRDDKGNIIKVEIYEKDDKSACWLSYQIAYNEEDFPVSILGYNYDVLYRKGFLQYNNDSQMSLFDYYWLENYSLRPNDLLHPLFRKACKYDTQGRIVRDEYYQGSGDRWLLDYYSIFYYSDGDNTSSVETGNNNPVDDTNKGGFDVVINIPADSIAGGSFVVKLPEGFTLDKTNTKLTGDFGDFDLVITQQEDNTWLLELKPKTLRSALLSGEAGSTLAHIAYTVDGKVKRGTYDISVNSIQFETPGGDIIPEPAIAVPVRLNRWGVGNEAVTASAPTAYAYGGTLYIQSPRAEQVTVYSLTGAKVYEGAVQAGTTTVNAARLPKGVYVVAFGDGTRQKVANN